MEIHISKLGELWETAFVFTRMTTMMIMMKTEESTPRSVVNMK